ncbi:hypothetical protein Tco_1508700 [Tanacetum coccineum]
MAENVIVAGSKNRPPMLEKGMYDSWKTRIILYILGKENGEILKDSIDNGPFQLKLEITSKDTYGVTDICHPQKVEDLSAQEKLRYDNDIKAVNILLLGLPVDIYTLIKHYQSAKEIWDRIKELMEGTEMTKQERESMLYDEFDKFTSKPGESIHSYNMRYAKLTNDMKMIPMSMSNMQINTKFVNHLQPEWSRFVTAAKQERDLHNCTTKKRVKDSEWFKDKMLLTQVQEAGVVLNDEQQDFLTDSLEETDDCEDLQLQATTNFKVDHIDAYDLDCDDEATTNAIFMANLSPIGSINDDMVEQRYDSDILSESCDELTSNNNVISYADYMVTISNNEDNYVPPPVQKNDRILSVIEHMKT